MNGCQAIKKNEHLCQRAIFKDNLCTNHYRQSLEGSALENFVEWQNKIKDKPKKTCALCRIVILNPLGGQKYCEYCKKQMVKLKGLLSIRKGGDIVW